MGSGSIARLSIPAFRGGALEERAVVRPPNLTEHVDWAEFMSFLEDRNARHQDAVYQFNLSKEYIDVLKEQDLSKLHNLSDGKRPHVLKALTNLSKFLGMHQEYINLVHQHGLTWGGKDTDQVVIDRLTKVKDPNEIFDWIRKAKTARPDLEHLLYLMGITGLRLIEALNAYNLIIDLHDKGELQNYYNGHKQALEHYRYKEKFIRHTKKAFISYVPESLIDKIKMDAPLPTSQSPIVKRINRCGLHSRFGDIREAHATFMTKFLEQSEIDFLHGRVSANVFMSNYFNPALIGDLKERVFQGIEAIKEVIGND